MNLLNLSDVHDGERVDDEGDGGEVRFYGKRAKGKRRNRGMGADDLTQKEIEKHMRRDLNKPIYSKSFPKRDVYQTEARLARGREQCVLRGAAGLFEARRALTKL